MAQKALNIVFCKFFGTRNQTPLWRESQSGVKAKVVLLSDKN